MKCFIYWTADFKSSKLWYSQLWMQVKQLCIEVWKSHFNGVWTRDLAIPVRRSNQLSYEATDVGSWSCVSSNEQGLIRTHTWPAPNVSGFIAQMVKASHGFKLKSWLFQTSIHSQLVHMHIRYHFIASLHITLHLKKKVRSTCKQTLSTQSISESR